jgi:hypothetical protein
MEIMVAACRIIFPRSVVGPIREIYHHCWVSINLSSLSRPGILWLRGKLYQNDNFDGRGISPKGDLQRIAFWSSIPYELSNDSRTEIGFEVILYARTG